MHHRAEGADRTHDDARLDRFRPHTAALDLVEAHFDGLAVALLLALIDRDVVHPHPVLLRDRRSVGQPHGIAVVQNFQGAGRCWGRLLPTGLERDFLVLIDRKVVAAVGVLLRFGRPIRRAARVAVVEDLACWWRGRRHRTPHWRRRSPIRNWPGQSQSHPTGRGHRPWYRCPC